MPVSPHEKRPRSLRSGCSTLCSHQEGRSGPVDPHRRRHRASSAFKEPLSQAFGVPQIRLPLQQRCSEQTQGRPIFQPPTLLQPFFHPPPWEPPQPSWASETKQHRVLTLTPHCQATVRSQIPQNDSTQAEAAVSCQVTLRLQASHTYLSLSICFHPDGVAPQGVATSSESWREEALGCRVTLKGAKPARWPVLFQDVPKPSQMRG